MKLTYPKKFINQTSDVASLCQSSITYFALKQLVVGNDQLLFLCCFGHIFDVSQQLVLIEELQKIGTQGLASFTHRVCAPNISDWCMESCAAVNTTISTLGQMKH